MALKRKITKAEWEALAEGLRAAYVEDGEDYKLDVEAEPPPPTDDKKRIQELERQLAEAKKPKPPASDAARIEKLEQELEKEQVARRDEKFTNVVSEAIAGAGFHPEASQDVLARVRAAGLTLQDDGSVSAQADGEQTVSLADFLKSVRRTAPHLHKPPTGATDKFGSPATRAPKKTLQDVTPEQFAAQAEGIAKGEVAVGSWAE